jgi:drug/metabolite transporter (DMT)-like permease
VSRLVFFATALAGLVLVSLNQTLSLGNERFVGMVAILLSAMIYSLTIVIFKTTSTRYTPLETLWFQNGFGAVFFLPFFLVNRPVPMLWQAGLAGTYGLLVGILGFGLFFFGLRKVEASRASFLTYIEVVSGIAFGVIFFDEHLSWPVIAGGSLILTSALALSRKV